MLRAEGEAVSGSGRSAGGGPGPRKCGHRTIFSILEDGAFSEMILKMYFFPKIDVSGRIGSCLQICDSEIVFRSGRIGLVPPNRIGDVIS